MLIRVRFKDGRIDLAPSGTMDEMIAMSEIEEYIDSSHWVVLGQDPVRSTLRGRYARPVRRDITKKNKPL